MKGRLESNQVLGDLIQLTQQGREGQPVTGGLQKSQGSKGFWGEGCSGSARISVPPA